MRLLLISLTVIPVSGFMYIPHHTALLPARFVSVYDDQGIAELIEFEEEDDDIEPSTQPIRRYRRSKK